MAVQSEAKTVEKRELGSMHVLAMAVQSEAKTVEKRELGSMHVLEAVIEVDDFIIIT
jgi:hypothetical protein